MLIKGALLFIAFGFLFLIGVLGVEYFLWLNSTGRFILLLFGIGVVLFLLIKYICIPLFYLFKLKKGISNKEASLIIGKHFPEVGDKLYNLLDLEDDPNKSELLLASIEQRSENLQPIPFVNAVTFKDGLRYIKYAGIPLLLVLLLGITGNLQSYFSSYNRVVNYELAYEPPAPFSFHLISSDLEVLENQNFTIQVNTVGKIRPEEVFVVLDGKELLLQDIDGTYEHTFSAPLINHTFYFRGNDVTSGTYTLKALKTPSIENFKMFLDYPQYTGLPNEVIQSTGNANFPEGTKVTWEIIGKNTEAIKLVTKDTTVSFSKKDNQHSFSKRVYTDENYGLTTSNKNVSNFEKLNYTFKVVKDAYPTVSVSQVLDSLKPNVAYYSGSATDDYKLKVIRVFCFETNKEEERQSILLEQPGSNFKTFYYTFPSGFNIEKGKDYSIYFEVTDNDAIHGGKTTKSETFVSSLLTSKELNNNELKSQKAIISSMDKSLEKVKEQKEALQEINKDQKEKNKLNFNDKKEIQDFLKNQKKQESLMQKFSKQLKDNLKNRGADSPKNKLLQERLERQELQAKKNEKLLEQLAKVAEKINKEELAKKLEELGKKQQNSERNLEQLLELTKRYYVTEKVNQLSKDLKELSDKQEKLSDASKENTPKKQEELTKEFTKISDELKELVKDNSALKKPLDIESNDKKQKQVSEEQKEAEKALISSDNTTPDSKKEEAFKKASAKQKSAAQKMKEISEALEESSSSSSGGGSSIAEDADMLRQILDNLVVFSFKQETLYSSMNPNTPNGTLFGNRIKEQQELRLLFEHVDDSLFSLSLRREELSEFVNEQITEVYYNIDKTLENVADGRIYQGVSNQKYVITAANSLSDFLANVLDNMQQSMKMGKGEGEGQQGFQLPDIIKAQGDLQKKMDGSGKPGQGKPGGKSGEGKSGSGGDKGKGKAGNKPGGVKYGKSGDGQRGGKQGNGGKGKEQGKGKAGNGGVEGNGLSESELKEIYEIYKSQQVIREGLEKQLEDMINSGDRQLGKKLLQQMEDFQNDLLQNGITKRTTSKATIINYELLKLENATLKKGKKSEKESITNSQDFTNPIRTRPSLLDNYNNETEILNRQSLPLRHIFKNKVKLYFKDND